MGEISASLCSSIDKADPIVISIVGALAGLTLGEVDKALDDARRVLWLTGFSGAPLSDAVAAASPSPAAVAILPLLEGSTVHGVDALLTEVRFFTWMTAWSSVEGSAFAGRCRDESGRRKKDDLNRMLDHPLGSC
jgi:hypothetical protein